VTFAALGYLGLNGTGVDAVLVALIGGCVAALIVSLVPMPSALRATILLAGAVTLFIVPFALTDPGLDRFAWFVVAVHAILGWLLGFIPLAGVRAIQRSRHTAGAEDGLG
jgi:hypothetical protein